jgi:hypothetical protein
MDEAAAAFSSNSGYRTLKYNMMGPRGASHCYIFKQAPRGMLFRSDLARCGQQDDIYSFIIPTRSRNSRCLHRGLQYGST